MCCVFDSVVNCLIKQFTICFMKKFAICLAVCAILLLNVMELLSVVGGAIFDICFLTFIFLWQISQIQTCLCGSRTWISLDITSFYDQHCQPASQRVRMADLPKKNGNRAHIAGGGMDRHNLHRVCHTAVTAPSRVGSVVWSMNTVVILLQIKTLTLTHELTMYAFTNLVKGGGVGGVHY